MIIATIPDKERMITKEFIILDNLKKRKEIQVHSQVPFLNSKKSMCVHIKERHSNYPWVDQFFKVK